MTPCRCMRRCNTHWLAEVRLHTAGLPRAHWSWALARPQARWAFAVGWVLQVGVWALPLGVYWPPRWSGPLELSSAGVVPLHTLRNAPRPNSPQPRRSALGKAQAWWSARTVDDAGRGLSGPGRLQLLYETVRTRWSACASSVGEN